MLKKLKSGKTVGFPADKMTAFKVDGRTGYYTIIDAVTICDSDTFDNSDTFLLLEHNIYGEDDMIVVVLPKTQNPLIIKKYNGNKFEVCLSELAEYAIYIPKSKVVAETYDDIITTLYDNRVKDTDIAEVWSDEEINKYEE